MNPGSLGALPRFRARKPAPDTLPPGTRLGRYQLIRKVGTGGMAELYLARSSGPSGFEQIVALKRMLPQYACQDEFVRMFVDEARLTAAVHHANVAQVHDIGQCDAGLFFTMEYVHGVDLRLLLLELAVFERVLPLEHALTVIVGAAAGLHAAHDRCAPDGTPLGIIHRDVTPSNVLVSFDGYVKLIDFGIAHARRRSTETRDGTLKGKVSYMSPEQCLGDPLDRRSDVFSLGIVLFEAVTGTRLYPSDREYEALRNIVDRDAPRVSDRRPGLPPELDDIVARALHRDRERRYPSAQALQLDLEELARGYGLALSSAQLGAYVASQFPVMAARPLDAPPAEDAAVPGPPAGAADGAIEAAAALAAEVEIEVEVEASIAVAPSADRPDDAPRPAAALRPATAQVGWLRRPRLTTLAITAALAIGLGAGGAVYLTRGDTTEAAPAPVDPSPNAARIAPIPAAARPPAAPSPPDATATGPAASRTATAPATAPSTANAAAPPTPTSPSPTSRATGAAPTSDRSPARTTAPPATAPRADRPSDPRRAARREPTRTRAWDPDSALPPM